MLSLRLGVVLVSVPKGAEPNRRGVKLLKLLLELLPASARAELACAAARGLWRLWRPGLLLLLLGERCSAVRASGSAASAAPTPSTRCFPPLAARVKRSSGATGGAAELLKLDCRLRGSREWRADKPAAAASLPASLSLKSALYGACAPKARPRPVGPPLGRGLRPPLPGLPYMPAEPRAAKDAARAWAVFNVAGPSSKERGARTLGEDGPTPIPSPSTCSSGGNY